MADRDALRTNPGAVSSRHALFSSVMASLLIVGIALCALLLAQTVVRDAVDLKFRPATLLLLAACYAVTILLASVLWRQLVYVGGGGLKMPWRAELVGLAALMIGKYVPGKVVGLFGRAVTLRGSTALGTASALTAIEQAYTLGGLITAASIMAAMLPGRATWMILAVAIVLATLIGPMVAQVLLPRLPLRTSVVIDVMRVVSALSPRITLRFLSLATLAATSVSLTAAFAPDLLGIHLPMSARLGLVAAYALAIVAGMVTLILPGGIGAREAAFVLLAQPWLATDAALAVAASLRLLNVAADLSIGIIGLAVLKGAHRGEARPS